MCCVVFYCILHAKIKYTYNGLLECLIGRHPKNRDRFSVKKVRYLASRNITMHRRYVFNLTSITIFQLQHVFKPNRIMKKCTKTQEIAYKISQFFSGFISRTPWWEGSHLLRRNEEIKIRRALEFEFKCMIKRVVRGCGASGKRRSESAVTGIHV